MNKHGWGLRAELAFILLCVICLIISTVGLYQFGLLGENPNAPMNTNMKTDFDYNALENKLSNAARKYVKEKYPYGVSDILIVKTSTLYNNGYLSTLTDSRDKKCVGYAKVLPNDNIVSYISCSRYRTSGYSEDYE